MKFNQSNIQFVLKGGIFAGLVFLAAFISGCDDDDPKKEDTPEMITQVALTFTPDGSGSAITATATDPDGDGIQDMSVDGPIVLEPNTSYTLTVELTNGLAEPADPGYDITEEVREESGEHMFFFSWTNDVFSDPAGNGNIDNRNDLVNYLDEDENSLPLGLETYWTTHAASSGVFRVMLKHQPDLKSESSTATVGETDLDIAFEINVE